jgi:hypothetical protein
MAADMPLAKPPGNSVIIDLGLKRIKVQTV